MTGLRRGDIALVDFNPAKGGEIGKLRPAVIMSTEEELEILETVIVIPLSTCIEKDAAPYRIFMPRREKLLHDSDACFYEIRALSKRRIKQRVAGLTPKELAVVRHALCEIVG